MGLVVAIGSIVTAGKKKKKKKKKKSFEIARVVSAAADEFGIASNRVKRIATDTKAVVMILRHIQLRLNSRKMVDNEMLEVLGRILAQCKSDIDEIQRCLVPLVIITGDSMTIKQKLRWLFSKSKISGKQTSLDSLKLTLTLFLNMMDFAGGEHAEQVSRRVPAAQEG